MKLFLHILFISLLFVSCGESSVENQLVETPGVDTTRYGQRNYTFPKLSQNAQEIILNWSVYNDFQGEATSLNHLTLEELQDKTDKLLAHTDSLQKKIPDTLFTNAIESRLMIVNTRVNLLNQQVKRKKVDSSKIEENILEANNAVRNFIIKINEKFEKDGIDLERIDNEKKELEKQKKFLDSVFQAELADKKQK